MKCWECKRKDIPRARMVFYYDIKHDIVMPRDVCDNCLPKLKFNKLHHVEVDNIRKTSIKKEVTNG